MPKLSSSLKKKRSKYLSPGRAKKKSKNKSKRTKSKKPRRRDDSDSYSGYESSSTSVSSSSSEDSYKGRKSRSYTRKDVKVSKKKSRAQSSHSEGSHRLRKSKRSKRSDEYEGKKKIRERSWKKKKARRDRSISSRSSGSRSCSTCQTDSGEDSDFDRHTNTPGRRDGRRNLEKLKSRTIRKRYDTSSSSSYSRQNEDTGHWSEKEMKSEITSKQLRSVIIFAKEDKEGRDLDKDEHKEEMINYHDDYPISRSNDSNDGGIKGDFAHKSSFESEKERHVEDDQEYFDVASKGKAIAPPETDKGREGQNEESKAETDRIRTDKYATNDSKNEISGVIGSTDGDLELILRQRALENLKRFRGGSQATIKRHVNLKDDSGSSSKLSLTTEAHSDQIRSSKSDGAKASPEGSTHSLLKSNYLTEMKNNGSEPPPDADADRSNVRETVHRRIKRPRLLASALQQALPDATNTPREAASLRESNKTKAVLGNSVHMGSTQTSRIVNSLSDNTNLDKVSNVPLMQESFDAAVNPVEVTALRESNQAIIATGSTVGESDGQVHVAPGSSNSENAKVENVTSSGSIEPSRDGSAAGDVGSNKLEDEGKEDSQLQEKTMSVMRGGELVQVNYKVYIPKKAPALARRRLKR